MATVVYLTNYTSLIAGHWKISLSSSYGLGVYQYKPPTQVVYLVGIVYTFHL